MAGARVTKEMLARLPKSREVTSFNFGVNSGATWVLWKCILRDGSTDVVAMPPATAFHIASSVGRAIGALKFRDLRRRSGDPRPELPVIRAFLDRQPDIAQQDWDGADESRRAAECEVHAFPEAVFLAFNLASRPDIYKALAVPPPISFYLVDIVRQMERDRALIDISAVPSASDRKQ